MKRFRCTHTEELFVEIVTCINAFRLLYSHAPFIACIPIIPSLPASPHPRFLLHDPFNLTMAICVTIGLGLSVGACWGQQ